MRVRFLYKNLDDTFDITNCKYEINGGFKEFLKENSLEDAILIYEPYIN